MADYQKYTAFLEEQLAFRKTVGVVLALLLVLLSALILLGLGKYMEKTSIKERLLCVAICIVFFAIPFCILGSQMRDFRYDIENEAYLTYEGEFTFEQEKSILIFHVDGEKIEVIAEKVNMAPTVTQIGKIVYAEKSGYLLYYELYES